MKDIKKFIFERSKFQNKISTASSAWNYLENPRNNCQYIWGENTGGGVEHGVFTYEDKVIFYCTEDPKKITYDNWENFSEEADDTQYYYDLEECRDEFDHWRFYWIDGH